MTCHHVAGRTSAPVLIVVAAVAVACGLWLGERHFRTAAAPRVEAAILYPTPRPLPDFRLTRADGKPFTLADWRGRWTLAFFGYTHCPDVCPTTLAAFRRVWAELGKRGLAERARIDFISVDPERDTPAELGSYVGFFSKDFVAATGTDAELQKLTRALSLVYMRVPDGHGGYAVDHSATAVIIGPAGEEVGVFQPPFDPAKLAADLATLITTPR